MLDAQAFQRVVGVGQPDPLRLPQDTRVDAAAAGGAAFDLDLRMRLTEPGEEREDAVGLRRVGDGQDAVVVPFQVVDVVFGQDRVEHAEQVVAHVLARQVQHPLLPPLDLVGGSQHPVGMGAGEVAVEVDHLGLDPEAECHALGPHMRDQRRQSVGPLAPIDLPVAEAGGVVVALAEPAVVQHEALGPQRGGAGGDVLQGGKVVVEIDRLPAVVVDGARAVRVWP